MKKYCIISMLIAFILFGCERDKPMAVNMPLQKIDSVPNATWKRLSEEKIYFGHQSVGDNIISGISELMKMNDSIKLNITKTDDPNDFSQPIFAHSYVGENDDPNSKIIAFRDSMQKGIADKADIAFFKFCFWDIRNKTDIRQIFENYKSTMSELKRKYPKVTFVHFTVPLMSHRDGLKEKIKRLLNMDDETDDDNIRRNELNKLLLDEYSGKEPIFDIAQAESTLPDGTRTYFLHGGKTYYVLADAYSRDGGHLNEVGKKVVAEQLLIFLAHLSEKKEMSNVHGK